MARQTMTVYGMVPSMDTDARLAHDRPYGAEAKAMPVEPANRQWSRSVLRVAHRVVAAHLANL